MTTWILVAAIGGCVSVAGFLAPVRRYRLGEIRGRELLAYVVGYLSFVSFALLTAFRPSFVDGVVTIVTLMPALAAVVVIVREHQRRGTGSSRRRCH